MADIDRMKQALRNAHKAGDVESARKLATAIKAAEPTFTEKLGQTWPAQLAKSVYGAVTLPGDVMAGNVDPLSDEAIKRSFDLAGVASPATAATRPMPKAPPPRPLGEGQKVAVAGSRIGVDVPRAVTSDRTAVQQAGVIATNVPVGGTPLRKASEKAIGQLDDAARRTQQGFGAGDVAGAGAGLRQGIRDYGAALDDLVSQRYDRVGQMVDPAVTAPLTSTARKAAEIAAQRENAQLGPSSAVSFVQKALSSDGLNYDGVKRLRTEIGQMLKNPKMAPEGTSQDELRAIYGALSDDLKGVVRQSGGREALSAFEDANSFAAQTIADQKALDRILGPQSDEGLFSKVAAMAGSTARADQNTLLKIKAGVSDDTWNEIASAVLENMGRSPANDFAFSPDRFVTAYNKLSETGRKALFGNKPELAQALDDIATVSSRFKEMRQYANPSGTGQTVIGGAILPGLYFEPLATISTIVGARGVSSLLARPNSANKVAQWMKAAEMAQRNPSQGTASLLADRAKVLSLVIANDMGAPQMARQIAQQLSGSAPKLAADEEGQNPPEGQRVPEQGMARQPRRLLPNEA